MLHPIEVIKLQSNATYMRMQTSTHCPFIGLYTAQHLISMYRLCTMVYLYSPVAVVAVALLRLPPQLFAHQLQVYHRRLESQLREHLVVCRLALLFQALQPLFLSSKGARDAYPVQIQHILMCIV